ncbi:MAG: capsular biosynthesis protein [Gammaproteobacteria bacterium]|nr:capsular biosynthesis protein [Gammaproteobacteria bacterium]
MSGREVRAFGSALAMQALLSATSFLVGLILVRRTSDVQYGYYVLVVNALLLLTTLQSSFIQPQMVVRMTRLDRAGRADLIGGLLREHRRLMPLAPCSGVLIVGVLWFAGILDGRSGLLLFVAMVAAIALLTRELFRIVLFAHRRPQDVLKADAFYVLLLIAGVILATYSAEAAILAVAALAIAAATSTRLLSGAVWRKESWNVHGAPGILRALAPLGAWSVAGAGIHWAVSQGYSYIVAGTLSVQAVAAIAATRLLLMPVNLLSAGIGTQLFPLTADWVHRLGVLPALRRLVLLSTGLVAAALGYFAVLWVLRGWIFTVLLKREFAQGDALLLLWCCVFILMLIRDQLINLLAVRERFRRMTVITGASAVASLTFSYIAMLRFGTAGAVAGVLLGELANVVGIIVLTCLEARQAVPAPA